MLIDTKVIKTGHFFEVFQYKNPIIFNPLKPFKHKIEKTLSEGITDDEKNRLLKQSTNRALGKIRRLILGNMYTYDERPKFITLSFDPKKHDSANIDYVTYEFKKFRQRLTYSTDKHLDYVATPEQHKSGLWHYHVLFFNMPFIPYEQFESEIWNNGGTNMRGVYRTLGTASYITKYLSKAFGNPALRNRKRYYQTLTLQPHLFQEPAQVRDIIAPLSGIEPYSIKTLTYGLPGAANEIQEVTRSEYLLR